MTKINHEEYEILKGLEDIWKWIARDNKGFNTKLKVHTSRPGKMIDSRWSSGDIMLQLSEREGLFQFVQWEDEEPYNIQELIEECEKEREETEVKRDIEWAKNKIDLEVIRMIGREDPHFYVSVGLKRALDFLNQIDETEVLSQEDNINIVLDDLKEHIKEQQSLSQNVGMAHTPAGNDTHYRQYDYVLECINEYEPSDDLQNLLMPKQELPAIPKFVADYLDFAKSDVPLMRVMELANTRNEWPKWEKEYDWISANDETFARAWLGGYTVEEEPKYFAKIKGHENIVSDDKYWNYCITDKSLDIGDNKVHTDVLAEYVLSATKDEWKNLGINEDNADFVEVEELEE